MIFYAKAMAVVFLAATSAVVASADGLLSSLLGGVVTIVGMGALLWKLAADHRIQQAQRDGYEGVIEALRGETARKDAENVALRAEIAQMRALLDDRDDLL